MGHPHASDPLRLPFSEPTAASEGVVPKGRRSLGAVPCLTGAFVLVMAGPLLAQDSQYWDIQYGPVGQLLGGQVVGSTRDLSATYYNPGGVILAEKPEFLLSVQAASLQSVSVTPDNGKAYLATTQTDFATFPGFFAFTFPKEWFGDSSRMAFSLLTRQQLILRVDQRFVGTVPQSVATYGLETLFDTNMGETWGGLTFSHRLSSRIGIGGTLYGIYRGQRSRTEQSLQVTNPATNGVAALVINDFDYSHWRTLGKVGVAWDLDWVRLGLTVTTPSLGLFGSGNLGFTRSVTGVPVAPGQPASFLSNGLDQNVPSEYHTSWAVAVGGSWRTGPFQVHTTAEWFAPVSTFTVLQGTTSTGINGPISLTQELDSVFNAGVALEYWTGGVTADEGPRTRNTALYGGFRTDFTASPNVTQNEVAVSNANLYHITGGTAFNLGSSRFSLGTEYSFGNKDRNFGLGGLPPGVPLVGEGIPVHVKTTRWVFILGYLFGEQKSK
jgi:hypothetical protein